jgi:hypothetical protein
VKEKSQMTLFYRSDFDLTALCRVALRAAGIIPASKDPTHYPPDASGVAFLPAVQAPFGTTHGLRVRLSASGAVNRLHRIHVACYQCGAWQDSGHFGQHVGSKTCKATATKRAEDELADELALQCYASLVVDMPRVALAMTEIGLIIAGMYQDDGFIEGDEILIGSVCCSPWPEGYPSGKTAPPVESIDLRDMGDWNRPYLMRCAIADHDPFQRERHVDARCVQSTISKG